MTVTANLVPTAAAGADQIVVDAELANYASEVVKLTAGCSILATGTLTELRVATGAKDLEETFVRVVEGW